VKCPPPFKSVAVGGGVVVAAFYEAKASRLGERPPVWGKEAKASRLGERSEGLPFGGKVHKCELIHILAEAPCEIMLPEVVRWSTPLANELLLLGSARSSDGCRTRRWSR
jgi:hypothetical protein